jgi:hypothetical protein
MGSSKQRDESPTKHRDFLPNDKFWRNQRNKPCKKNIRIKLFSDDEKYDININGSISKQT